MSASAPRKIWDIHGGVHPPENKQQSLQTPIQRAPIPDELTLPFSQHIGAPSETVVRVGDKVLKGQMIARPEGMVSVPLHAPTSGEVIAIEDRPIPHPSGMSAPCIVIKPDGRDEWIAHQGASDYTRLSKAQLVEIIRNAGIAGMGGAGFPSAVKLNVRDNQPIDTLIINGTECEPYITADDMLMRERADEVIAGVKILQQIIAPRKEVLIGIEDNKPEAIAALQQSATGSDIEIVVFPTKYPSGGEKQLIQILTGKEVPSGSLPAEIGIVCQNIGSTTAIYRAVVHGEPLISRITTVTGDSLKQPQNYEVLLGTPIATLLEASGFQPDKANRLIMGGPMMGFSLPSTQVPIIKTTNCILAPTEKEAPTPPPAQACIRCGMCAEACPVSLLPQQMFWFSQAKDHESLEKHHLFDCIECGACSYVCPSHIPLVQYYRASKAEIRRAEAEHKKAEYAKARFEARQERLAKVEAEKEAKRRERQQKAAQTPKVAAAEAEPAGKPATVKTADPVQAAIERAKAKTAGEPNHTAASDDPVQAAIERAKAKRTGNVADENPRAKLEKDIASLKKRLATTESKLQETEDASKSDVLKSSLQKLQNKLQQAESELAALQDSSEPASLPATASDDPVQAAIERAKAKRAGKTGDNQNPKDKLQNDIASLKKRLATTESKLLETEDTSKANALKGSLEKMQDKLQQAERELAALQENNEPAEQQPPFDDPVQAAIERAKAKRAGKSDEAQDPKTKLDDDIAKLEKRMANAQQKLQDEDNADKADALKGSLEKLQTTLQDKRHQRQQLD